MSEIFTSEELMNKIRALTYENEGLREERQSMVEKVKCKDSELYNLRNSLNELHEKAARLGVDYTALDKERRALKEENRRLANALKLKENLSVEDMLRVLRKGKAQNVVITLK